MSDDNTDLVRKDMVADLKLDTSDNQLSIESKGCPCDHGHVLYVVHHFVPMIYGLSDSNDVMSEDVQHSSAIGEVHENSDESSQVLPLIGSTDTVSVI
ncbi:hypothetical protein [Candidatus Neoehrlichia procyonis]|uniref:Uncharacterized protein n=1 Tax=Candidatus Neoehrlichia procyonis str. RAC413 TaxID=1359163 RepID=A0A0F3NNH8_9RICK|nr:hypothetical protein [Candidatus Neoehrlichia lotoris]KJV69257.1 hypothetical protein NLO413_0639 [Candidatus Neoehrlichia lotoris str. RAC413]